jgi:hypothetical protein
MYAVCLYFFLVINCKLVTALTGLDLQSRTPIFTVHSLPRICATVSMIKQTLLFAGWHLFAVVLQYRNGTFDIPSKFSLGIFIMLCMCKHDGIIGNTCTSHLSINQYPECQVSNIKQQLPMKNLQSNHSKVLCHKMSGKIENHCRL